MAARIAGILRLGAFGRTPAVSVIAVPIRVHVAILPNFKQGVRSGSPAFRTFNFHLFLSFLAKVQFLVASAGRS
jgi:hypothetical protein